MEKFLNKMEKIVEGGIGRLDDKELPKVIRKITEVETELKDLNERKSLYKVFLDKLHKILAIIKE